ncbi:three-Cys-motif partner protein TcmP [Rubrivivax rivuli]|uniref:Three-Cys-motif partner protein TcmP n=1 Tax=Rubrivivax rivuli TaxID=1862385 RepID=A0A437RC19_9BURK|nr:three-Cys-motif partner protein TcmP [Rubrivivax rivuli]RVU44305.1 three-Cys-motif partner protein TcmP [Rubrivivax rivuli]
MATSIIPETYEGREQAMVKHALLKSYLEKLVLIIGMSAKKARRTEICFVDCFAGPWGAPSEDLDGTSISLSLKTLAACKEKLATLGVDATMRALYIEKDKTAFDRLSAFLSTKAPPTVAHACLRGDFVDLRDGILTWCGTTAFTFFFIDPKGWKDIVIATMRPLLQRPRSEFLINFAYNFINRTASMADWQDAMTKLLGSSVNLDGLQPSEREQALVNAYRTSLKGCVPTSRPEYRPRSAYVTVLDPLHQRTKYHLVYVTCHPTGIVEFMDISERVDLVQRQVRAAKQIDARQQKTGVTDMFGADPKPEQNDGRRSPDEVDAFWRRYLSTGERRIATSDFAEILETTNWLPGDLQSSLVRLVKAGAVRNLDADASKRRSKPLHFDKAERLQLT